MGSTAKTQGQPAPQYPVGERLDGEEDEEAEPNRDGIELHGDGVRARWGSACWEGSSRTCGGACVRAGRRARREE